jgi:hypothetical protein
VLFFADGITIRDRWDRLVHFTTNPKAQDAVKTILDLAKKIRQNPPIPRTGKIKSVFFGQIGVFVIRLLFVFLL